MTTSLHEPQIQQIILVTDNRQWKILKSSTFWAQHRIVYWTSKSIRALLATCFHTGFLLLILFDPEDGGGMFLWKVGWLTSGCKALYPREQNSSWSNLKFYVDENCPYHLILVKTIWRIAFKALNVHTLWKWLILYTGIADGEVIGSEDTGRLVLSHTVEKRFQIVTVVF
jgi:hypothetical protein